jgi:plastocyanin
MHRLGRRAGAMTTVLLATAGVTVVMPRAARADVAQSTSVQIVQSLMNGCHATDTPSTSMYCFEPPTLTVASGATVTWTNQTAVAHTVTRCAATQNSNPCPHGAGTGEDQFGGTVQGGVGQTFSFSFTGAGTYYYYSLKDLSQPGMQGEVIVMPPATSPTPVQLSPGPATAPSNTPIATATPAPTANSTPVAIALPSDTPADVAVTTPSADTSPAASGSFPIVAGGNTGGGSTLVIVVLAILTLIAVGGGVLSFRLFRR